MSENYTIQELASICQVSKTSIYNRFKNNQDFIKNNSHKEKPTAKNSKAIIKYNQSVLDWLLAYYDPSSLKSASAGGTSTSPEKPAKPQIEEEAPTPPETKIKALEAEIEALRAQLEEAKREKAEIQNQLGIALLCLQQEKAEKQLYLPAPKKSIGEKIKHFFGGNK